MYAHTHLAVNGDVPTFSPQQQIRRSGLLETVHRRTDLSLAARSVYTALVSRLGRNSECWPSLACIARDAGVSTASVKRATAALEAAGLLSRDKGGGGRRTTRYRLLLAPPLPAQSRPALPAQVEPETKKIDQPDKQAPRPSDPPPPAAGCATWSHRDNSAGRGVGSPAVVAVLAAAGVAPRVARKLSLEIPDATPESARAVVAAAAKRINVRNRAGLVVSMFRDDAGRLADDIRDRIEARKSRREALASLSASREAAAAWRSQTAEERRRTYLDGAALLVAALRAGPKAAHG